ncbi:MAG: DUF3800 domain-containing protein [Dehalococcoidales bacterium]|nr:DUF3800 domain-containing protein [Dehalococcoidales bacterium]
MNDSYNIYCDESCHLENDKQAIMLLGAISAPQTEVARLLEEIKELKEKHSARGELKWGKVSNSKLDFYIELIDWFMNEERLKFRSLVILHKDQLDHIRFNAGSHDDFYYKMYFSLLSKLLSPDSKYNIYLDIKDTRSRLKLKKLKEVLCNDKYDFTSQMITRMQNVRSHESPLLQVCDFLLGAVSYKHRGLCQNPAKVKLVNYIEKRLGRDLLHSTPLHEQKFNLFLFTPRRSGAR